MCGEDQTLSAEKQPPGAELEFPGCWGCMSQGQAVQGAVNTMHAPTSTETNTLTCTSTHCKGTQRRRLLLTRAHPAAGDSTQESLMSGGCKWIGVIY